MGQLKQALDLELQSFERSMKELDETRKLLGWRGGLSYVRGNSEAGYPPTRNELTLKEQAREVLEQEGTATARQELSNVELACEAVAGEVQAHNRRLRQQGLSARVFLAPWHQWRAMKLDRQQRVARQRRETAEAALSLRLKAMETDAHNARVASLAERNRSREREMAIRRQGVELRRSVLVDEMALRQRLQQRLRPLPGDMKVPVNCHELSAAIKDPALMAWLLHVESKLG